MKKIQRRSFFAVIIALLLTAALCIYLVQLFSDGQDWAMLRADKSVYSNGVLDTGTLMDRNDVVLAQAGNGVYAYAADGTVRRACFHVVGDYAGNIGTGALNQFAPQLAGYDIFNGTASLNSGGGKVRLTIDSGLNVTAYNALAGRKGSVLVSNYKTGEILCMVSNPSYDPNTTVDLTSNAYSGVFLNRCISSTYVPGSVYKIITLAAAIDNIPDLFQRSFWCEGSVKVGGDTVKCTGYHGTETIEQAFANSCNCAFSELAQTLGSDVLEEYAEKLGVTASQSLSGIETAAGNFETAALGTSNLSWSGIGQYRDLASPYAMLRVVSAVANDGEIKEPVLLLGTKGKTVRLLEKTTADTVAEYMSYNVAASYGQWNFPNLSICAKTGTAEVGDGTSHAWFVGFLNDETHPYAFVVMLENAGGGLANAGPVANTVLQAAVAAGY